MLDLKPVGYEIINLGGSQVITINQLIQTLEDLIGRKARVTRLPRHPADMSTNLASVEKAGQLLGWQPSVSLEEGIARLVAWYQAERSWAAGIKTT